MAKTFSPVTPVSCNYTVDTKSSTLKSANIRVNEVPASFRILKQKTNGAGATVLPPLTDGVRTLLAGLGARPWQIDLAAPVLVEAILHADREPDPPAPESLEA